MAVAVKQTIKRQEVARANAVLDEDLINEAKEWTGIQATRALIEEALRSLVQLRKQDRIWELYGTIQWDGDLNEMRRGRFINGDR